MGTCQFGSYEVLARLASGGAAHVFLARRPRPKGEPGFRLVCLKTLLPRRAHDEDFLAMFEDEAELGQFLSHPGCVQVEASGEIEGLRYQAMEFVFGMNIWELLGSVPRLKKPLPRNAVAQMLADACRGLHFAHQLKDQDGRPFNLIHRDISPQNIMISYDGQVKVLDFGVARAETGRSATATGIVKGKFAYMSPEQIAGTLIDHRSDLYSMGIIMFECLASRRLYKADSPQGVAKLILENRPPSLNQVLPDIDDALASICAKALAFSPDERFSSAEEMAMALDVYLRHSKQNSGRDSIKTMITTRFGEEARRREAIVQAIRKGDFDESKLMSEFGARPVTAVDFRPDVDDSGALKKGAPRIPFAVDLSDHEPRGREQRATGLSIEHGVSLSEGLVPLCDPEDSIQTTTGDGLSIIATAETDLNTQSHFSSKETAQVLELVSAPHDTVMTGIQDTRPVFDADDQTEIRRNVSNRSTQTYTLGVVLTAFLLGCFFGLALGLFLARSLGLWTAV